MGNNPYFWQIVLVIVNIFLSVIAFFGAIMVNRLIKSIDNLAQADAHIKELVVKYREDLLLNYPRHETLALMKQDIVGRVDRLERFMNDAFHEHARHEKDSLDAFKLFITSQITHFQDVIHAKIEGKDNR